MYFSICDDVSIRNYKLKGKKGILIRILEPSYKKTGIPYTINNLEQYKEVLELYINDTTTSHTKIVSENDFDSEKARILNDFILKNNFDEVVVHCSLGISRSPAIMICIAKILNNHELETIIKDKYRFYNSYIVDVFESTNYSIKTIGDICEIKGNILEEKTTEEDNNVLIKILK